MTSLSLKEDSIGLLKNMAIRKFFRFFFILLVLANEAEFDSETGTMKLDDLVI
jgi:hypothetical protein